MLKRTVAVVGLVVALACFTFAALAATESCYPAPDGEVICLPLATLEWHFELDPDPVSWKSLSEDTIHTLNESLGPDPQPWVVFNAETHQAFLLDMEHEALVEVPVARYR